MGWSTGTGAFLRRTATGGTINCVGCVAQSGNKIVIQDDPRSITIRPAVTVGTTATVDTNIPVTYDSMNYVEKNALLSSQAISSTAFVTIGASGAGNGPMTFGVEPLDFYKLSCRVIATSSAATAGPQIQVTGPASPTFVQNNLSFVPQAALSTPVLYSSGFSTAVSAGAAVVSAGTALYTFEEYIQAGAAGGTISVQDAPQGTGTLTNLPGTECDLTPQTQVP
jgi:hypothetical protein